MIGKYFAQARFYDSAQGRMLSPDPVKRGLNPYPYCDNDPVNYVDPTGEIPTIVAGGFLGGFFGGGAGFVGSVLSQVTDGREINWRKVWGSAANGFVVGAARGALIGSGAGIPLAFATDFTAGSIGDALEQGISTGHVNLGKSLIGGAENALSQMLYGTGKLKSAGSAFAKGFGAGAVSSGLRNIEEALWPEDRPGSRDFGRKPERAITTGGTGRDPKRMCGSPNPFDLAEGLGNGRGYHSGRGHGGAGHSRTGEESRFGLGGLVKDMLTGGIVGGLSSAGFYGAGKAVEVLREGIARRGNGMYRKESNLGDFKELDELMQLKNVKRIAKLVKTLGHERMHVYQVKVFGKPTSSDVLINFEKAAYSSEKHWWDYYNLMNGGK